MEDAGGRILEKPKDAEDAMRVVSRWDGRTAIGRIIDYWSCEDAILRATKQRLGDEICIAVSDE